MDRLIRVFALSAAVFLASSLTTIDAPEGMVSILSQTVMTTGASAQGDDGPGEECFTCFAEQECWITGCFPVNGTVDCVDAVEEDEETASNCKDDELNTECSIEEYGDCEQVANEEDALAFLVIPGAAGAQGGVLRVQEMVYCATGEPSGVRITDARP